MNMIANFAVAVMAAVVVTFLTFVTTAMPSHSVESMETPDGPILFSCEYDPRDTNHEGECRSVIELPGIDVSGNDYGHSNEDPNDPSNDPSRNHDER